jgi:cytochrome c553
MLAFLATWPSITNAAGDIDRGRTLAAQHCAKCHTMPDSGATRSRGIPPSFQDMAAYRPEKLQRVLSKPHWPNRSFVPTADDTADFVAYVASLKE